MDGYETQDADGLVSAFVAAFPEFVLRRLSELGFVAGPTVISAVDQATGQLAAALREVLALPPAAQTKSPLELMRDATLRVTGALTEMGVRPRERDSWDERQHPEDRFGLYPASSQDLGEEAWGLHLQWGTDKARMVVGVVPRGPDSAVGVPSVALFGVPIDERDPLAAVIAEKGYRTLIWRNPAALADAAEERPVLVVIDLRHRKAHGAIKALTHAGIRTVAISDQVDDLMMPGVLALGAVDVIASDRIAVRLDGLLPRLA